MEFLRMYRKFLVFFGGILILSCGAFANDARCTSSVCQETGEEIISSIDHTVDACTDFFQHACGGWIVKHPVPSSEALSDQFAQVERKVEQDLKDLLENDQPEVGGAIQKAKDFYKSCLDLVTIDSKGLTPLMSILTANGNWPLTVPSDDWNPQNLTWQKIHENFMKVTEYAGLFKLTVEVEQSNSKAHVITFKNLEISSDRLRITNSQKREVIKHSHIVKRTVKPTTKRTPYEKYVLNAALEFTKSRGLNVPDADVEADVKAMLAFRTELKEASKTESDNDFDDGSNYRIITIKEAQDIWNVAVKNDAQYKVDWLETIKKRFEGSGIVIDENEKLALNPGIYFERLATLLSKTPVRTIVNYIHWYAVSNLLALGDKVMRGIVLQYFAENAGITKHRERWRTCSANHMMPHALSYMYVKKHFTTKSRASVIEMIDQLREATKEEISHSHWMGENARTMAKEKVDAMINRIGYPDWYDEPGKIDKYYDELEIGPNYFENFLAVHRFDSKKLLRKLRKPAIEAESEWEMSAIDVNAAYVDPSNSLNFPAAIFQMPIYHYEIPAALKFGGIGAIIGHEISHGFDNTGRLKDKDGNKRQWWSNSTIEAYDKKVKCFVKQYSQYEITKNSTTGKPIYINGVETLDETVADNLGFPMSFKAFQRYKRLHPDEIINIPALKKYSDEKLYFYGLANVMCDVSKPELLEFIYPITPYPPNKVRINGALSNMEEFASTFGCPAGSKMNPTKKCVLWD